MKSAKISAKFEKHKIVGVSVVYHHCVILLVYLWWGFRGDVERFIFIFIEIFTWLVWNSAVLGEPLIDITWNLFYKLYIGKFVEEEKT